MPLRVNMKTASDGGRPRPRFTAASWPLAEPINRRILTVFIALTSDEVTRRTHFLDGHYENLYLERDRIPELGAILDWRRFGRGRSWAGQGTLTLWVLAQRPGTRSIHLRAYS